MDAMIAGPFKNVVLKSQALKKCEEYPERQFGLVGSVSPQPMRTSGDAQARSKVEYVSWNKDIRQRLTMRFGDLDDSNTNYTRPQRWRKPRFSGNRIRCLPPPAG